MTEAETSYRFGFERMERIEENGGFTVKTYLKTPDGIEAVYVNEYGGGRYITAYTELINRSDRAVTLEMLSTFCLYGISPYVNGAGAGNYILHRARSKWSREARFVSEPIEDYLLEESWCYANTKSVRFGQIGSMPVKDYFPFMAVEDRENGVIWGVSMECQSSWQMEIARRDDGIYLSGGIADRELGHWTKTLAPGESMTTNKAYITVCKGGLDEVCDRLLDVQRDALDVPESEESLPVIFNEYCTTWGNPSQEKINSMLNALAGKGIEYFVIDCGWFREDGVRWDISMGDYVPSATLFPDGIKAAADRIRSAGMLPGIWFEPENVGAAAEAYNETAHLLRRDGITLTTMTRRFWDMRDPWVRDYLRTHVIDFLRDNGFGYIKIDYNDTIGIGCDSKDSLGEGLRLNMAATVDFFEELRQRIPELVIENCASGGNRLEPGFMARSSMASFSDAHECVEIPIIAAELQRLILPRQAQIWCVIRKDDSQKRIAYSIAAAFLGRMCLSGDVTELSEQQWDTIKRGIAFYKAAAPIIKNGKSRLISRKGISDRHPKGWQASVRTGEDGTLITVHAFEDAPEKIELDVPEGAKIRAAFSAAAPDITLTAGKLILKTEDMSGYGIILR